SMSTGRVDGRKLWTCHRRDLASCGPGAAGRRCEPPPRADAASRGRGPTLGSGLGSLVVEVTTAAGAGSDAEQLTEHGCGGAPDGVADQFVEDDRPITAEEPPPLFPVMIEEFGERDVKDGFDLSRVGPQCGAAGERDDIGDDERLARP